MIVAATATPLFDWNNGWTRICSRSAVPARPAPTLHPPGQALGEVSGYPNCVLEGGTIDAFAEQLVADASAVGDVLVILARR